MLHSVGPKGEAGPPTELECLRAVEAAYDRAIADAERFRWLLAGNGYFMEENSLCGPWKPDEREMDHARAAIDKAMARDKEAHARP